MGSTALPRIWMVEGGGDCEYCATKQRRSGRKWNGAPRGREKRHAEIAETKSARRLRPGGPRSARDGSRGNHEHERHQHSTGARFRGFLSIQTSAFWPTSTRPSAVSCPLRPLRDAFLRALRLLSPSRIREAVYDSLDPDRRPRSRSTTSVPRYPRSPRVILLPR